MPEQPNVVWLIGPESVVYHLRRDCPALSGPDRYYPVKRGVLLSNGTVQITEGTRPFYEGRRPCGRCGSRRS